jgi:hypothetical protein
MHDQQSWDFEYRIWRMLAGYGPWTRWQPNAGYKRARGVAYW